MENAPIGQAGSHPEASLWGTKGSWMLYSQMELYAAQARVILPSLYAPFGLPQPTVNVTSINLIQSGGKVPGWPRGQEIVARAWRQETNTTWCGHLVVVSGAEQSGATFTLQLGGFSPVDTYWASRRAVRLFAADYQVPISADGQLSDMIDAAGHNIYQLGDCGDIEPPPPPPPPPVCSFSGFGCYNDTGLTCGGDTNGCILPSNHVKQVHDHVTKADCAGQCLAANLSVATKTAKHTWRVRPIYA